MFGTGKRNDPVRLIQAPKLLIVALMALSLSACAPAYVAGKAAKATVKTGASVTKAVF